MTEARMAIENQRAELVHPRLFILAISPKLRRLSVPHSSPALPRNLLYATSARLGGTGLDVVALESMRAADRAGLLGKILAFENRQHEIAEAKIRSLRGHPVRLLSGLGSASYYAAKKHALDRAAAREIHSGRYDFFHGWSGESVRTLRRARELGIPSVIEIPTWHRHKGRTKSAQPTKSERARLEARGWRGWKERLLITRQQMLEEYELADLLLVLSQKAEETFLAAGVPAEKLFRHQRGVDVERFCPAEKPPEKFRAIFVGALIERKGVQHLLRVWRRLNLRDAELVLVGSVHEEMRAVLTECAGSDVRVAGFVRDVEKMYQSATVHIFPSTCEGSAKATYEAAACGLAQITTRESGDVVLDGVNGLLVPPDDPDALAEGILRLYHDRALVAALGAAGRQRVVEKFTWAHFGARLLEAYATAFSRASAARRA